MTRNYRAILLPLMLFVAGASYGEKRRAVRRRSGAAPVKVTSVEGITEYRLANGLRVLLFPDPTKPTVTVNITYLVGSRHEGYGETGMAHLLEHLMFKGTPTHPDIPQELNGARRALQRHHLVRPHQLLRDVCRPPTRTSSGRSDSRPTAWSTPSSRRRISTSEMTVVRNEFEAGENDPADILEERVLSTAYLWHNYGKSTIGARDRHRERADRAAAGLLSQLLPAGQRGAARRRQVRRAEGARPQVNAAFGAIPRPTRTLQHDLHRGARRRTASASVTLRRVGRRAVGLRGCITCPPRAASRLRGRRRAGAASSPTRPPGRLYKALVETKKATASAAICWQMHDPAFLAVPVRGAAGDSRSTPRATRWSDDHRRARRRRPSRRKRSTAPRRRCSRTSSWRSTRPTASAWP